MKRTLVILGLCGFSGALSGCATLDATVQDAVETASGRITEVKHRMDEAVLPVIEAVDTVNKRVQQVQSGAQLIRDGVDTLKQGVRR